MTSESPADRLGWTLHTVLRRTEVHGASLSGLERKLGEVAESGVDIRGIYDVTAMRADADVMLWLTGGSAESLQDALRELRRVEPFASLELSWSAMGVHREAEFSRDHSPSFMKGLPPKRWLTVYPFVRSYEWYLLPDDERRAMLADHGRKGSEFPQVQPNTTAAFGLGDYEWILALESDELIDLVDMMRRLRYTDARRHVREEIPFYTGRRIEWTELLDVLQ
ncbi:MAG: chlorite dismutase family protein [Micrococcales bacterium]|nr:chlorite dismutase family protein [Micrococcales bacterium]